MQPNQGPVFEVRPGAVDIVSLSGRRSGQDARGKNECAISFLYPRNALRSNK